MKVEINNSEFNGNTQIGDTNIITNPDIAKTVKDELVELINQLNQELQKASQQNGDDAEAVTESTKELIEAVNREKPNKPMISIKVDGLSGQQRT